MEATVADVNPKTLENAKRQFVELYGSALVMNTYLKIALVLVSLVAVGLLALNFHTASQVRATSSRSSSGSTTSAGPRPCRTTPSTYRPQAPELRYFLTQFVVKHFSRIGPRCSGSTRSRCSSSIRRLADATIAQNEQSRVIETFVTNPSADEVDVVVQNVSLSELTTPPYKASVSFQKVFYTPGTRHERARETLRRAGRFRAPRPRAERVRPRQSARPAGHVLPRGSGVRGGQAMIANTAFWPR